GRPDQGIIIGRLEKDGRPRPVGRPSGRFFAHAEPDAELLSAMTREEFVGRKGRVSHDAASRKNLFRL
ncbi:MAG TPA: hypothetical protein VFT91_03840, partial [Dehalococcoidia bacterium]|nr:hypothetical protein [Dehalococcoidia bacterium]